MSHLRFRCESPETWKHQAEQMKWKEIVIQFDYRANTVSKPRPHCRWTLLFPVAKKEVAAFTSPVITTISLDVFIGDCSIMYNWIFESLSGSPLAPDMFSVRHFPVKQSDYILASDTHRNMQCCKSLAILVHLSYVLLGLA